MTFSTSGNPFIIIIIIIINMWKYPGWWAGMCEEWTYDRNYNMVAMFKHQKSSAINKHTNISVPASQQRSRPTFVRFKLFAYAD